MQSMQFMRSIYKYKLWIFLFAATILLELWLSNDITAFIHPEKQFACSMEQAQTFEKADIKDNNITFPSNKAYITLDIDSKIICQNIYLEFESEKESAVSGNIQIKDESRTKNYEFQNEFIVNPGGRENTVLLPLHSRGHITSLRIELTNGVDEAVILKKIILNYHNNLQFHLIRWIFMVLILSALFIIKHFRLLHKNYDFTNSRHLTGTILILAINFIIILIIGKYAHVADSKDIAYPLEKSIENYSIFVRQFDAFQKGQLNIDIDTDHDLEELDNAYDYSERLDAGNHWWSVWDHVYVNQKYYCYFGVTPILTLYYPHYLLTKTLPSDAKTCYLLSMFLAVMGMLLIIQALKCFDIKANITAVFLSFLLLPAASRMLLVQSCSNMYYIPYLSATAWLATFGFASLKAYEYKKQKSGFVWFAIAGIALVLAVGSRPTTAIAFIALAAPFYLHILFDRQIAIRQKTGLVTGFAIPISLGAAALMWYNYARFGSVFDFGIANQLTVADIHYNHISVSAARIFSYVQQYWLLPLQPAETFPFINYTYMTLIADGSYFYHQINMGILAIPINYMLFTIPLVVKKSDIPLYQRAMIVCGFCASVIIVYINYCLGGIHIRYACDASYLLLLLSVFFIFYFMEKLEQKQAFFVRKLMIALMIVSLVIGYLIIFTNECNYIKSNSADFYIQVKNLFTIM